MERSVIKNDLRANEPSGSAGADAHECLVDTHGHSVEANANVPKHLVYGHPADGCLVDTHCHLHDREFFTEAQAEEMLERAKQNNVQEIVCISTSLEDTAKARDFAMQHQNVYWTYGVHPEACDAVAGVDFVQHFKDMIAGKALKLPVAIGEVGLDYHYVGHNCTRQIALFEQMLQLAVDNDLPVSFHIREAFDDFFPVVANYPSVRGVVHSFTDSKKTLRRILETTDFYVGVNGLATYSTLPLPPLERILLETDAPFLTPVPFRGMINEPGHILNIAQWLSAKLDVEFKIIERETTKNATRLYRFPDSDLRQE